MNLFYHKCRSLHLHLLDFMRLMLSHFFSLLQALWMAARTHQCMKHSFQFGVIHKLAEVPSLPLSMSLMNIVTHYWLLKNTISNQTWNQCLSCPCSLLGSWTRWPVQVSSNPSYPVILWFFEFSGPVSDTTHSIVHPNSTYHLSLTTRIVWEIVLKALLKSR